MGVADFVAKLGPSSTNFTNFSHFSRLLGANPQDSTVFLENHVSRRREGAKSWVRLLAATVDFGAVEGLGIRGGMNEADFRLRLRRSFRCRFAAGLSCRLGNSMNALHGRRRDLR